MEWINVLITLVTATLASLGFAILFYVKPQRLPWAVLGGLLTCVVYIWIKNMVGGELLPNFAAAFTGAVFSEVIARVTKAPVTVYLMPCIIPLAPGGMLYETMSNFVSGSYAVAGQYALLTLQVAVGIVGGIAVSSVVGVLLRHTSAASQKRKHTFRP